jgi:hypothetical protein
MPTDSRTTSVVAALSVVVAVVGHVLAGGGSVPFGVVPPLAALAAVCWLLGEYLAGERLLTVLVLACVQLFVHVTLDNAPQPMDQAMQSMDHEMAMPGNGLQTSLLMAAAHLSALLAGVLAVSRAHRWINRVVRVFARLLPVLPVVPVVKSAAPVVPAVPAPRLVRWWLVSSVSRRGPPVVRVIPAV